MIDRRTSRLALLLAWTTLCVSPAAWALPDSRLGQSCQSTVAAARKAEARVVQSRPMILLKTTFRGYPALISMRCDSGDVASELIVLSFAERGSAIDAFYTLRKEMLEERGPAGLDNVPARSSLRARPATTEAVADAEAPREPPGTEWVTWWRKASISVAPGTKGPSAWVVSIQFR